ASPSQIITGDPARFLCAVAGEGVVERQPGELPRARGSCEPTAQHFVSTSRVTALAVNEHLDGVASVIAGGALFEKHRQVEGFFVVTQAEESTGHDFNDDVRAVCRERA